jgi:hypothetical protein
MGMWRDENMTGVCSLTLFYEENELLRCEDQGKTEEDILLGEMGEGSGEHAADTMLRAQSGNI